VKKTIIIILICFLLLVTYLCGCNEEINEEKKFFGTWESEEGLRLIINSTEECIFYDAPGVWSLDKDTIFITISFPGGRNKMSFTYQFSEDLKTLTLTDQSERYWIFEKQ